MSKRKIMILRFLTRASRLVPKKFSMFEGTTILGIRHGGKVVLVGDGQVSLGQTVMKHSARKVRKLHHDRVIAGFAGATADAVMMELTYLARAMLHHGLA